MLDWFYGLTERVPVGRRARKKKPKPRPKPKRLTVNRVKTEMPVPTTGKIARSNPKFRDPLLPLVEQALKKSGESAMVFGLMAVNDTAQVTRLRNGQHVKKAENRKAIAARAAHLLNGGEPKSAVPEALLAGDKRAGE